MFILETFLEGTLEVMLYVFKALGAGLCNIIYWLISRLFQLFMVVSQLNILSSKEIGPIYQRITLILTIVMVFYITFEFVKYVVQPDAMVDKEKGAASIVKRMIIAIVLIAMVPTIFTFAYDVQNKLIKNQIFSKIILGEENINFDTFGSSFSADMLGTFYGLNEEACGGANYDADCRMAEDRVKMNLDNLREGNKVTIMPGIGEMKKVEVDGETQNIALIKFDGLMAVVIGGVILYLVVLYTIDVGTRYAQLIFLQIMSPIAIMGYISPKKDNIFSKWLKQCITTYLDLFIRLSIIYFVLLIIRVLGTSFETGSLFAGVEGAEGFKTYAYIALVMGLLVFAGKAPKMIGELLPVSGGAASIGYGFKGGDRFAPGWNATRRTVGGVAGAAVGLYKGFKDGKKQKAWSAVKAGYQGVKAGAGKNGGLRAGMNAARDSVNKDIDIADKGGTPLGHDLFGGIAADKVTQFERTKKSYLEGKTYKEDVYSSTNEISGIASLKTRAKAVENGGGTQFEIDAENNTYKSARKAANIAVAREVMAAIAEKRDVDCSNIKTIIYDVKDGNGNKIVRKNPDGSDMKDAQGNVMYEQRTINVDNASDRAYMEQIATKLRLIKDNKLPTNSPLSKLEIIIDESTGEKKAISAFTVEELAKFLGDIEVAGNTAAIAVDNDGEYIQAKAEASEKKGN